MSDSGSAEKIGPKRDIEKLFWPKNKIPDSVAQNAWAVETRRTPEFVFSAKKAFQYLFFGLFFQLNPNLTSKWLSEA